MPMNKVEAIIENPGVEEHIIFFTGVRHMHAHWEQHLDPILPYEWSLMEYFYNSMRSSLFGELKHRLKTEVGINPKDPDFAPTLEAAIDLIVAKHGMKSILEKSRAFLHIMAMPDVEIDIANFEYAVPKIVCPACNRMSVSMNYEDLPVEMLPRLRPYHKGDLYGFCQKCKTITQVPD
jgi:hypothetical protein